MASFADILNKINTGAQIAQAIEPTIAPFGADHIAGTQQILQIAGAAVAAETSDATIQAEAVESAELASSLVPLVFAFKSLFSKKAAS
jgi:hypothetical protein